MTGQRSMKRKWLRTFEFGQPWNVLVEHRRSHPESKGRAPGRRRDAGHMWVNRYFQSGKDPQREEATGP
eukprot:3482792-Prorocentrum_lima.AAC.1